MQKSIGKRTKISEKTQVNCKWKLIGICNNPKALAPIQKQLSNVKHENKHVTGNLLTIFSYMHVYLFFFVTRAYSHTYLVFDCPNPQPPVSD